MSDLVINFDDETLTGLAIGNFTIACKLPGTGSAVPDPAITVTELWPGVFSFHLAVSQNTAMRVYPTADVTKKKYGMFSPADDDVARQSVFSALLAFVTGITALVDIGAGITAELGPITMEKGENKIITIQVLENGVAKDCTGYAAQLGVKGAPADTAYKVTPVDGVFSNDANGVLSMLTFTIAPDTTKAMTPFGGVYSAAIYDGTGKKYPLPPERGGLPFVLKEDVLDVA